MVQEIENLFHTYRDFAFTISILINIVAHIVGVIPIFFLTAINVKVFGMTGGFICSVIGESLGVGVTFILYRLGFKKMVTNKFQDHPRLQKLLHVKGKQAFWLLFSLRMVPFLPSSLITFFAALGEVSFMNFFISSSIGKIPMLLVEVIAVGTATDGSYINRILLVLLLLIAILYYFFKKKSRVKS